MWKKIGHLWSGFTELLSQVEKVKLRIFEINV